MKRSARSIVTRLTVTGVVGGLLVCFGPVPEPMAQAAPDETAAQNGVDIFEEPADQPVPEEPTLLYATRLIDQAEVHADAIADMPEVAGVEVMNLSTLSREDADDDIFLSTMDEFMLRNQGGISMLRNALSGNDAAAEALTDAGVEVSSILAAEIRPDLALRVYVRDW